MIKVLFLDDEEIRHKIFKDIAIKSVSSYLMTVQVRSVYTAQEAIDALKISKGYDIIFLDHDLGNKKGLVKGITGYTVAKFIAEELPKEKLPTFIVVHSWNGPGAKRIQSALRGVVKTVYIPFGPNVWPKDFIKPISELPA